MPWPKGMSRVGYIRKDGLPHAGRTIKSNHEKPAKGTVVREERRTTLPPVIQDSSVEPQFHGYIGNRPVTEVCPKCYYVYADGGYCSACGWMLPIRRDEYGTHSGPRY